MIQENIRLAQKDRHVKKYCKVDLGTNYKSDSKKSSLIQEICLYIYAVKPLRTITPWEMKKWPSYRGGRLIKVISLRILRVTVHLGNGKVAVL